MNNDNKEMKIKTSFMWSWNKIIKTSRQDALVHSARCIHAYRTYITQLYSRINKQTTSRLAHHLYDWHTIYMTGTPFIWLAHHLYTWCDPSCILLLNCKISLQRCSVLCHLYAPICHNQWYIFFMCNGRSLIRGLKTIGPKTKPCGTPNFTESSEE